MIPPSNQAVVLSNIDACVLVITKTYCPLGWERISDFKPTHVLATIDLKT
ncbi:hypothetical protein ACFLS0_01570 [Candidatus Bipolaricaulota bacterium]